MTKLETSTYSKLKKFNTLSQCSKVKFLKNEDPYIFGNLIAGNLEVGTWNLEVSDTPGMVPPRSKQLLQPCARRLQPTPTPLISSENPSEYHPKY